MPLAKVETPKKKNLSLLVTIIILSTGVISAVVFVLLQRNQAPETPAATISCPTQGASCQWPSSGSNVEYQYTVTDMTTTETVIAGKTTDTKVTFTPIVNHRYRCAVRTVNACGTSSESMAEGIAGDKGQLPPTSSTTPTTRAISPTTFASPSASLSPTIATTPLPTAATQATASASITPPSGGSAVNQSTPTPTKILIVAATNTPGPSPTQAPIGGGSSSQSTTAPTQPTTTTTSSSLPETGLIGPSLAIFAVATIVILFGLVL